MNFLIRLFPLLMTAAAVTVISVLGYAIYEDGMFKDGGYKHECMRINQRLAREGATPSPWCPRIVIPVIPLS